MSIILLKQGPAEFIMLAGEEFRLPLSRLAKHLSALADVLLRQGKLAGDQAFVRELVEQGDAGTLNALARQMAVSDDPKMGGASMAVSFAEKAVAATGRKDPNFLNTLAAAYAEAGQFGKAVTVQREAIALLQDEEQKQKFMFQLRLFESNSPYRSGSYDAGPLSESVLRLLEQGKFAEAESPARQCLAIREKNIPDHWRTFNARSMLGGSLLGQRKYAEAEPLLLSGYEGLKQRETLIPAVPDVRIREALQRLVQLYEATGKTAQATEWKRKLGELAERGDTWLLNHLAWEMATSDDPKSRDGSMAVNFAEKAVTATNRKDPNFLNTLAAAYAEVGQFRKAVTVQQEAIALLRYDEELKEACAFRLRLFESHSPYRSAAYDATTLAESVRSLLEQGKFAEAESSARECLAIREKNIPDHWRTFNARSMLGGSLLGQRKYAEAEPLLLSGYEGLKLRQTKIPVPGKPWLQEALQRLVQLYEATGRTAQATEWKQKLAEFDPSTTPKAQVHAK